MTIEIDAGGYPVSEGNAEDAASAAFGKLIQAKAFGIEPDPDDDEDDQDIAAENPGSADGGTRQPMPTAESADDLFTNALWKQLTPGHVKSFRSLTWMA